MTPRAERCSTAWERVARRTADIVIAGFALLVLSPLMAIIVIAIRLTSPGPALFTQRRIGLARRPFCFYKFRTMRLGGDDSALREMIASELRGKIPRPMAAGSSTTAASPGSAPSCAEPASTNYRS